MNSKAIALLILPLFAADTVRANDIVDFLRAISGPSRSARIQHRYADNINHRHDDRRQTHQHFENRFDHRYAPTPQRVSPQQIYRSGRPQSSWAFSVSVGNSVPQRIPVSVPAPVPVLPEPPVPGSFGHLPHTLGQFVTCPVPLTTCVRIKDADEIAPGAVPMVVAVRDPHLGRFRRCVEQLVYVEVCVPPCPVQRVRISPCKTKIRLDYGRFEVDIVSRNGVVEIDYDN